MADMQQDLLRLSQQVHGLEIANKLLERTVYDLQRRLDQSETSQHISRTRDDSRRLSTVELTAKLGLALLLPLLVLLLTGNENAAKLASALMR